MKPEAAMCLCPSGGLAIAVPGEVSGFYAAWQMFGRVDWPILVQPTIDLCETGFIVEADLSSAIKQYETAIRADPNLSYVLYTAMACHNIICPLKYIGWLPS